MHTKLDALCCCCCHRIYACVLFRSPGSLLILIGQVPTILECAGGGNIYFEVYTWYQVGTRYIYILKQETSPEIYCSYAKKTRGMLLQADMYTGTTLVIPETEGIHA